MVKKEVHCITLDKRHIYQAKALVFFLHENMHGGFMKKEEKFSYLLVEQTILSGAMHLNLNTAPDKAFFYSIKIC